MKEHSSMADFINLKSLAFINSKKTTPWFLGNDFKGISLIFRHIIYVMLPNHSAESKTNRSTVPIALHSGYLSKSHRTPAPWLFGPASLWLISSPRTADMQASCQWQELEEIPSFTLARTFFLFPSPVGCQKFWLVAGVWQYFQVLKIRREEHHLVKSDLKNRNRYWIIQSVSLSFRELFPTSSTMTRPIFFPREKNVSLQHLFHLSLTAYINLAFQWTVDTVLKTQSMWFLVDSRGVFMTKIKKLKKMKHIFKTKIMWCSVTKSGTVRCLQNF